MTRLGGDFSMVLSAARRKRIRVCIVAIAKHRNHGHTEIFIS